MSTFALISLAEMGDKSQLVCMTLAARYRHMPVLLGSVTAFMLLNVLAVMFGVSVATWIPENIVMAVVALLFGGFGVYALIGHEAENASIETRTGHSIFITTFLLLFIAEFGDKTQIAVAGLASSYEPIAVWAGASIALIFVSAVGIWAGRTLLAKLPMRWIQRISGGVFLVFSALAAWQLYL